MSSTIVKFWPLLTSLVIYWTAVMVLVILSTDINNGQWVYPLDDTYIHMAIAKNSAIHHVWGVTKHGFTSATSSPLWTAIIALTYSIFGINETAPLLLNLAFGTLLVTLTGVLLAKKIVNPVLSCAILFTAIFAAPLPSITISGMEHTLHILLAGIFIYVSSTSLGNNVEQRRRNTVLLLLLAPLVAITRYEGEFLVFAVCTILLSQKRIALSVTLGIISLLPIIIYGLWSLSHGWLLLPNSVLLKGQLPEFSLSKMGFLLLSAGTRLILSGNILWLVILSLFILVIKSRNIVISQKEYISAIVVFISTTLLHMTFSSTGWFYRYEAYIVYIGIIIISLSITHLAQQVFKQNNKIPNTIGYIAIILVVVFIPFSGRIFSSLRDTPQASRDRFLEHITMAKFIQKFYNNSVVALNDIGAVAYFTDAYIIDIYGLSSMEPYYFRMGEDGYSKQDVYEWTRKEGVEFAYLQIQWNEIQPRVPDEWEMVSQWEIPQNVVFHDTKFGVFAVNPLARDELIHNLISFAAEMPMELKQTFR